jgi:hypothetical protein
LDRVGILSFSLPGEFPTTLLTPPFPSVFFSLYLSVSTLLDFSLYYIIFYHYQEGEPVEFTAQTDERGRLKAEKVTGPMGAFVQGAPRRSFQDDGGFGGGGGGFGGGGGGFGGGGGGFGGGGGGGGGFGGGGGGFGGFDDMNDMPMEDHDDDKETPK